MIPSDLTLEVRVHFWSKVDRRGPDECWEWQAGGSHTGYGSYHIGGHTFMAHRVAYVIANGNIPPGYMVMHTCDNRGCMNPAHLRLGTSDDNIADKVAKERSTRGATNPQAKLTADDVRQIRQLHVSGVERRDIAERFGVHPGTVGKIVTYQRWNHTFTGLSILIRGVFHYRKSPTERFWAKVDKKGPSECWTWHGVRNDAGYGIFNINHKDVRAHRFSYQLAHGDCPDDLEVRHLCGNPGCVNPDHLALGTHQDNMHDMVIHGRSRSEDKVHRGSKNGLAKLTEEQVLEIRHLHSQGVPKSELARRYGVDHSNIQCIVSRKTWKHI